MKHIVLTGLLAVLLSVTPFHSTHAATNQNQALIEKLLAQIQVLQAELNKLIAEKGGPVTPSCTFTRLLVKGTQGTDVTCLQNYLKKKGHFNGTPTGLFGPVTEASVAQWQRAEGIVAEPWEYGRFGEQSRGVYARSMTSTRVATTPVIPTPTTPETPTTPVPVPTNIPSVRAYTPKGSIYFAPSVPITVTTDMPTTCKYGTSSERYGSLPFSFQGINTIDHSATVSIATGTQVYKYYVRCITAQGVESERKRITFEVSGGALPKVTVATGTVITTIPARVVATTTKVVPASVLPAYTLPPVPSKWRMGFFWPITAKSYPPDFIPWSKYTHVSEMQIMPTDTCGINDTTYKVKDSQSEFIKAGHDHGVRVLITLGDSKSGRYLEKCTGPVHIDAFVATLKNYVETNQYDGLDVDWEDSFVPAQYKNLIVKLRASLPTHTLTTDIGVYQRNAVAEVQDKLDRINLMSYDMYATDYSGKRLTDTWHNTAILSANDTLSHKSAEADLYYLLASKIAPQKINLGLPFYGYEITGCQEDLTPEGICAKKITGPLQPVSSAGIQIKQISYAEVLSKYANMPIEWDATRGASYIRTADSFVTFSDPQQMKVATQLLLSKGLGGVMTFSFSQEYVGSQTGDARYPLSSAIYETLQSNAAVSTSPTKVPLTASQTKTTLADLLMKLRTLQAELKKLKNK